MLGMHLYEHYKEEFPSVKKKNLRSFLHFHDQAKIRYDPSFLAYYGHSSRNKIIIERVFEFYGINIDQLILDNPIEGPKYKNKLFATIKDLNALDENVGKVILKKLNLFSNHGQLSTEAIEIMRIEKIVDLVDRGMSKISPEEFAKSNMIPASKYLKDPKDQKMARYLESQYDRLVSEHKLSYAQFKKLLREGKTKNLFQYKHIKSLPTIFPNKFINCFRRLVNSY